MCVSVVILTYNEQHNIATCLDALSWCDDIWIVDSHSTDKTIQVARAYGAKVLQRAFDSFSGQRNYALDCCGFLHEWVLHLDADEVCTPQLHTEIINAVKNTSLDAFRIPSKTMFHDKWLKYSGMYPCYQVRLGRHPRFRFVQVGHGQREAVDECSIGTLEQPYLHYSFSHGIESWFSKHNRYSTDEALHAVQGESVQPGWVLPTLVNKIERRRLLKRLSLMLPFRPSLRFLYMFVVRRGFLDGAAGYQYCRLLALYEGMIDAKIAELRSMTHVSRGNILQLEDRRIDYTDESDTLPGRAA